MKMILKSVFTTLSIGLLLTPVAQAEPPYWAPAYGYRYKHGQDYRYRYQRNYVYPRYQYYGHSGSSCDGELFGTVLGGAVGGAIGNRTARDPAVGTLTGVFVGAVVGNVIGRSLDETDRRCSSGNHRRNDNRYRMWRR